MEDGKRGVIELREGDRGEYALVTCDCGAQWDGRQPPDGMSIAAWFACHLHETD
ncbi:MAG: hypothetical protein AB7Q27_05480 [Acidimicrobiia bacterium]